MVLHFSGFSVGLTIFLLPILYLSFQSIAIFLHFGDYLLILIDLDFIIFVIIDFTIELQLLFL